MRISTPRSLRTLTVSFARLDNFLMAQTLMGVVYDARTLAIRRIIVPDDDAELADGMHVPLPGEAMTTAPRVYGLDVDAAIAAIRLATGREPPTLEQIQAQGL